MARIAGRNGRLYVGLTSSAATPEAVTFLRSWSIDFSTDDIDVTALGDTNKVTVPGIPTSEGSFAGFFDDATTQLYLAASDTTSSPARKFYLYPSTPATSGPYWFGTATFDFSVEGSVDGAVTVSGNWSAATAVSRIPAT